MLRLLQLVYLHCSIWPPSAKAALPPTLAFKPHPSSTHFVSSPSAPLSLPHAPGCFSTPPASSSPLTLSGFFNGMLGASKPGALNYHNLSCLIPLTLFVSRNLTLIYLPLSESLDSLFYDLIAPTPGLAFFLLMPCMLVVASTFLSGKSYSLMNFLLLSLRLMPTLIM